MSDEFKNGLVDAYPKLRVFAYARTKNLADADDLVQSTIQRALEKRSQFKGGSVLAWTLTIARNLHMDQLKLAHNRLKDDRPFEEIIQDRSSESTDAESNVMLRQVLELVGKLGERCRDLLIFSAQGFKTREIAEWLNIPAGTAMRNMFECRKKLFDAMQNKS